MKFKKKIIKHWRFLAVIMLALLFFVGTSSLNLLTNKYSNSGDYVKWESPDETANYVFAKLYGQENKFSIEESYNILAGDIMHPRSFRSDKGLMKPVSFLGLPIIYGQITQFTSYKALPFLTPLFAAVGLVFYYLFISRIFNRRVAFIATVLLASFPPFVYYTVRSMFHNVLFVVLLIIGAYFLLLLLPKERKKHLPWKDLFRREWWRYFFSVKSQLWQWPYWLAALAAGIFMGLAAGVRTSELLWLLPVLLIIWLMNCRQTGLVRPIIFAAGFVFALLPVFYHNQILYGSFYFGGYPEMNKSIITLAQAGNDLLVSSARAQLSFFSATVSKIINTIFHFGFKPAQSIKLFYIYFPAMFGAIFWPAAFGFIVWLARGKRIKYRQVVFLTVLSVLTIILVFYYGSWRFYDNPDRASHTIGNSYTRYWLPIYLGALPWAGLFIARLGYASQRLIKPLLHKRRRQSFWRPGINSRLFRATVTIAIVSLISFVSIGFVLSGSAEGLVYLAQKQTQDRQVWEEVIKLTEENAVIITKYHDKLLFPERKVIIGMFNDPNMTAFYAKLIDYLPVYYFNFTFPPKDMEYLNTRRLYEQGMSILEVKKITSDFTLYKLEKLPVFHAIIQP